MTMKRPSDEKLAALREAVADPAKPLPVADAVQEMFLGWADRFTAWHLRVLAFLDDPKRWFATRSRPFPAMMMGSLSGVLTDAYPELRDRRDFYDLVAKDLWLAGLLNTDGLHAMMYAGGAAASRTTDLGKQFLRFIADAGK
jgi:hypothetical protein